MKKNIVFLDIDGVLNYRQMPNEDIVTYPNTYGHLSKDRLKTLLDFIEDVDGYIVVSSTWRKMLDVNMGEILEYFGLPQHRYLGDTPDLGASLGSYRGNEIQLWINQNRSQIKSYIILDDDSDMLLWQASHYLNINNEFGFTKNMAYRAKRLLESTRFI